MQIKKVTFLKSVASEKSIADFNLDEIAVVGRSNVGKSSFINMLSGQKIAKTSSTPGRTRLVNYFNFDEKFILVDLPGYGYAKASKTEQGEWGILIEGYLKNSKNLKNVILLVDIRHDPTELDKKMLEYLYFYNISCTIVATKADKIAKSKQIPTARKIASNLKVGFENVFIVSSETGKGKDEILQRMMQFVGGSK